MPDDLGSLLRTPIELTGKYRHRIENPPSLVLLSIAMGLQASLQSAPMMGGRLHPQCQCHSNLAFLTSQL